MHPDPIADLICSGRTITETAEAVGQSALAVYLHCERLGLVAVARAVYAGRDGGLSALAPVKRSDYIQSVEKQERNAQVIAAVLAGETCQSVGDRFGLTRKTVSRLVQRHRDRTGLFVDNSDYP